MLHVILTRAENFWDNLQRGESQKWDWNETSSLIIYAACQFETTEQIKVSFLFIDIYLICFHFYR